VNWFPLHHLGDSLPSTGDSFDSMMLNLLLAVSLPFHGLFAPFRLNLTFRGVLREGRCCKCSGFPFVMDGT
jgi:hypothetical protein